MVNGTRDCDIFSVASSVTPALSARALTPCLFEDLAVNIFQEISSGLIHAVEDFVEKDLDVEEELPRVLATEAGSGWQFKKM